MIKTSNRYKLNQSYLRHKFHVNNNRKKINKVMRGGICL